MTLFADNPVIVADRELEEKKKPGESEPPCIRCPAKRTNGFATADTNGTRSTRAACVRPAYTSGLKRNASHAADGRRIRCGTWSDRGQSFITSWHPSRTDFSLSAGGITNFSPGRDDIARRHCSNAGLLKRNKITAGPLEAFSTPIQLPCGMNTVAPIRASYCRPAK